MSMQALLVGCGKMGGALLAGWRRSIPDARIVVVEPHLPSRGMPSDIEAVADADQLPADFSPDAVILAIKPQMMEQALPAYAQLAGRSLFLSIAAGKPLAYFQERLGPSAAIVRAMPNTPAAVGCGISVAIANRHVNPQQKSMAQALLAAVGDVAWADDEALMDAVTAVSGSGPAYVFLLTETLARAGELSGLPADLAMRLARSVVIGSGELLRQSHESAEQLRRNVTSPKGTTQAALDELMAPGPTGLAALMQKAVAAAANRSRELAT
jgi:pyrroline-5-carboxylate reductase